MHESINQAEKKKAQIDEQKMQLEISRMKIKAHEEAKAKREAAAVEAGTTVLINIVDQEDVSHPYRAFRSTWDSFQSQFGNMIKRNEDMEQELLRYRKKVEEIEAKIAIAEANKAGTKISTSSKKADFAMEDPGEDY